MGHKGHYVWDTRGLRSGEYAVAARIDDSRRGNGMIVAWAPGTVIIDDTTPPPAPVLKGMQPLDDALIVTWWAAQTRTWPATVWNTPFLTGRRVFPVLQKVRNVLPKAGINGALLERVRLGGLLNGFTSEICVRSYDASGNVSPCTPVRFTLPPRPGRNPFSDVRRVTAVMEASRTGLPLLNVKWLQPADGKPQGYLLYYQPVGCMIPGAKSVATQGKSPIDVGNVLTYQLTGLTFGQRYLIGVRGYAANGYIGPMHSIVVNYVKPPIATRMDYRSVGRDLRRQRWQRRLRRRWPDQRREYQGDEAESRRQRRRRLL